MKGLILNCGSSSVKFSLFHLKEETSLARGLVEKIGFQDAGLLYQSAGNKEIKEILPVENHRQAVDLILRSLCHSSYGVIHEITDIDAVGHRVVHGGEAFSGSVFINEAVLQKIQECVRFAPLHNPPNIEGIKASLWYLPFARQVAVFDTSFHQTMPSYAFVYGLPYEWYLQYGIRRFGFHGTSHRYVAREAAKLIGKPLVHLKMVTCHLGNGASITAVNKGISVDTSMGFTPLEGLVMGTRCGDIDPAVPLYLMEKNLITSSQMDTILNKKSGLAGITGGDSDLRTIEKKAGEGSERHQLALEIFAYRVKKYIGAYAAAMGGLDGLVFTAGIGEKSSTVREMICRDLGFLGVEIELKWNKENRLMIHRGRIPVLVIPTNEELAIAYEVVDVLSKEKESLRIDNVFKEY